MATRPPGLISSPIRSRLRSTSSRANDSLTVTVHRRSERGRADEGRSRMVELLETVSGDAGSCSCCAFWSCDCECGCWWGVSSGRSALDLLNWRRWDDQFGLDGPGVAAGALRDDMKLAHEGGDPACPEQREWKLSLPAIAKTRRSKSPPFWRCVTLSMHSAGGGRTAFRGYRHMTPASHIR